jgi:hypothetical protein
VRRAEKEGAAVLSAPSISGQWQSLAWATTHAAHRALIMAQTVHMVHKATVADVKTAAWPSIS